MKHHLKLLLSSATILALMAPVTTSSQVADTETIETDLDVITVNARKREESLTEVPVSISVLDESLIEDTNILTQDELFSLVPGISYSEALDRNSAAPNVRGVQSNEIATNRTKVTQFIDGMPVLGSQGNIQFGSVQQVEVFRGPQSAAFGRSTFGGAINYVTKDPGSEFEAELTGDFNDYGTRRIGGSVGGPITDTLGFLIDAQWEDSTSPDDFIATDGVRYGELSSKAASGKLVWTPTDNLEAELTYSHVESADSPRAQYFITQAARDECFDGTLITDMGTGVYANGEINCDWDQGTQIISQIDRVPAIQAAIDAGTYGVLTAEQEADLIFLADALGIREERAGSFDNRDRVSLQVDYTLGNGALIQASGFIGDENYVRETDASQTELPMNIDFSPTVNGMGDPLFPEFPFAVTTAGPNATVGGVMADPSEIQEKYVELRYVSPGEDRLRYVVGGSYYDYEFVTNLYFLGYNSVLEGTTDRYFDLTGTDLTIPNQVFQETASNIGVFGNLSYDVTDRLTVTGEARYQIDDVGGYDTISGLGSELTTKAFLPRLSANYNLSDTTSFYAQYAKGNNPAGVNVGFFNPDNVNQLDCTDAIDVLGPNGESACGQNYVNFNSEDFKFFEEEKITNYEVGMKGAVLDNRLQFAAAVFMLDWTNQGQAANLNWGDPTDPMAMAVNTTNRTFINEGDIQTKGIEFEGTFDLDDNFSIRAQGSLLDSTYKDYCDVALEDNDLPGTESLTGVNWLSIDESGTGYSCVDVSGNNVPNTPSVSASLSPSWRTQLDNGLRVNARADVRFTGNTYVGNYNFLELPAVTTTNVSAGLSGDSWSLTAYINNISNEDQPSRIGRNDDETILTDSIGLGGNFQSNYLVTPRAPRTIGLRARLSYR